MLPPAGHLLHLESKRFSSLQQEHDEPVLKHLQDIKVKFSDPGQPMVSLDGHVQVATTRCVLLLTCGVFLPTELHIRVPLRAQRVLHKHSVNKDLQDEVGT